MKYSDEFKEKILTKIFNGVSIAKISKDTQIPLTTIYSWKIKKNIKTDSPSNFPLAKKYKLLLDSKIFNDDNIGQWLRENGIHSDHLKLWDTEVADAMTNNKYKDENRALKEKLRKAEREINKKDKALAEAAALLVLKKKYQYLWEDEEK